MDRDADGRNVLSAVVEKMSSSLIMHSPNWVAICRKDTGEIIFANDNFLKNTGYLAEEVLGRSIFNLPIFPKHNDLEKKVIKLNVKTKALKDIFEVEPEKIGNRKGFLVLLISRLNYQEYFTFIFDDRTDLISVQNKLKISEERYRGIFENMLVGVYIASACSGEILDCNEYFAKTLGFQRRESVKGLKIPGLIQSDFLKINNAVSPDFSNRISEIPLRSQDGRLVWVMNNFNLNEDDEYIEGVIVDITKRKEMEELQVTSEFRFRTLIENATDYKFIIDTNGRCQYTSPSVSKMLGYSSPGSLKNIFSLISDKDSEKFYSFLRQVSHTKEIIHGADFQIKHRNGTYRTVHMVAKNLLDIPKLWGIIINAEDITDKIKAQEEMANILWKEQELGRQKTQFISTVSHDFRTPLTNISLNIQLLERYVEEQHCDHIARNVERIKNATKRLTALLNEVSLISKEQSGHLAFNPELCRPSELLDSIIEQVDYLFQSNVDVRIHKNSHDPVMADRSILAHITDNLLGNALKFTPDKSLVCLSIGINKGSIFKLEIKDKGIGIPSEEIEFVFDPYFRASNAGSVKGNGLGLSIVRRCVELHHGIINIKSRKQRGTTVIVEIPLK